MEWTKVRTVVFLLALVFVPLVLLSFAYHAGLPSKSLGDEILSRPMFRPILCRSMSSTTATPYDVPSSGPGVFETIVTLCQPPELNKAVPVIISVRNNEPRVQPKVTIEAALFKRTNPREMFEGYVAWNRTLWSGDFPANRIRIFQTEVRIDEPGLYSFGGGDIYNPISMQFIYLKVTENSTDASTTQVLSDWPVEKDPFPFPRVDYIIKMDFDRAPALNRPVNLRVSIAPLVDGDNVTFKVFLPTSFTLVGGDLVWRGDIRNSQQVREGIRMADLSRSVYEQEGGIVNAIFKYGKFPPDALIQMQATVKAIQTNQQIQSQIVVLPVEEFRGLGCNGEKVTYPLHPSGQLWHSSSLGGCIRVLVFNETDAIFTSVDSLPKRPPQ